MSFVGRSGISSIKTKRNSIPFLVPGLPGHQFSYIVFGDLVVKQNATAYTVCGRFDDG